MKKDHRSKFSNLSNWKEEAWKKKNRASTGFEPVTSALPVRCSTSWAMKPHIFTPHGRYELNKLTSLPMCGFIAQLVEQRTGNAEVTGSNPVEALVFFFRLLLSSCLNWKIYCDDHSSLSYTTAVLKWIIFIYFSSKCNGRLINHFRYWKYM